jgi:hypothetical protein
MTGSPMDGAPWWAKAFFYPMYAVSVLKDKIKFWGKK